MHWQDRERGRWVVLGALALGALGWGLDVLLARYGGLGTVFRAGCFFGGLLGGAALGGVLPLGRAGVVRLGTVGRAVCTVLAAAAALAPACGLALELHEATQGPAAIAGPPPTTVPRTPASAPRTSAAAPRGAPVRATPARSAR